MINDNQEAGVTLYSGPPEFHSPSAQEQLGLGILFVLIAPIGAIGSFVMVFVLMAALAWSPTLPAAERGVMQEMFWMLAIGFGAPLAWFVWWCVRKIRSRGRRTSQ